MIDLKNHRRKVQVPYEEGGNLRFILIDYFPEKNKSLYQCVAGHLFEMHPEIIEQEMTCPSCRVSLSVNRKNAEYKKFFEKAIGQSHNRCEFNPSQTKVAVHHIYSIRMYPELAYDPQNAIVMDVKLHNEYHKYFSPYNTNGSTFFGWLKANYQRFKSENLEVDSVINKLNEVIPALEKKIQVFRSSSELIEKQSITVPIITEKKTISKLQRKLDRLIEEVDLFDSLVIISNRIYVLSMYWEGNLIFRNEFGNWYEKNPITDWVPADINDLIMKYK